MSSGDTTHTNTTGSSGAAGRNLVASYESYEEAQRAVDRLSDASFPVEAVEIVGRDLRTVERVTGRLTTQKAAPVRLRRPVVNARTARLLVGAQSGRGALRPDGHRGPGRVGSGTPHRVAQQLVGPEHALAPATTLR